MESSKQVKKRTRQEEEAPQQEDVEMDENSTGLEDLTKQRKIIKVKKRAGLATKSIPEEEDGEDAGGIEYSEDEFEEEEIVERENDEYDDEEAWEDMEDQENAETTDEKSKNKAKKKVWNEVEEPVKEDEELVFDNSAY